LVTVFLSPYLGSTLPTRLTRSFLSLFRIPTCPPTRRLHRCNTKWDDTS
jgi:hypothetical protein